MTDQRPPFDEFDLRRALTGHATTVRPAADPVRLHDGLVRADRMRTMRAAATAGVMAAVVTFGVLNLQGVEERSSVDTVDRPDVVDPSPSLPAIDDASAEEADPEGDEPTELETAATTTAPPTTLPSEPDHLSPTTTTAVPVVVVSTTAPPTSSTTAPPTTAPTTTVPTTTTSPPTTTSSSASFTAAARYGSCELDPPYDEYSGTAAPGATVTITSPYSDPVQVTAAGDGTWAVTVFFPSAPANETFTVSLSDGTETVGLAFVHIDA